MGYRLWGIGCLMHRGELPQARDATRLVLLGMAIWSNQVQVVLVLVIVV